MLPHVSAVDIRWDAIVKYHGKNPTFVSKLSNSTIVKDNANDL
jgi:hypothetical protein